MLNELIPKETYMCNLHTGRHSVNSACRKHVLPEVILPRPSDLGGERCSFAWPYDPTPPSSR